MSILIKGMDKPTDCDLCPFEDFGYCNVKGERNTSEVGVDADCPLIEVAEQTKLWIPCEERLPSEDGKYLTTWSGVVSELYYGKPLLPNREVEGKCFYESDAEWGDVPYDDVVAWMPLPKPYEAEQTEPQTCEECEHWNDTEDGCADRHGCKTEPNGSEIPNNCKYAENPSGDVWECSCFLDTYCEHQIYDRNPDGTINIVKCGYEPKTEPQYDAEEVAKDINRRVEMGKKEWITRHIEDEPQTDCSWGRDDG